MYPMSLGAGGGGGGGVELKCEYEQCPVLSSLCSVAMISVRFLQDPVLPFCAVASNTDILLD